MSDWRDDARALAESVAGAADRALGEPPPWRPGTPADDRSPELSAALATLGWADLAADAELAPLAGPAALELGRRLAPLRDVDALLGGSPLCGDLVRYGGEGARAAVVDGDAIELRTIMASQPCAYGDALGVHRVLEMAPGERVETGARIAAWTAATVGYMAGVGEWALETAVVYVRDRRAFGSTIAALAPVQQRLADAATAVRGLRLLAYEPPEPAALAYAGPALVAVTAACQQVVGGIGFTLEFPLQRAFRRARALQLWSDAVLGLRA